MNRNEIESVINDVALTAANCSKTVAEFKRIDDRVQRGTWIGGITNAKAETYMHRPACYAVNNFIFRHMHVGTVDKHKALRDIVDKKATSANDFRIRWRYYDLLWWSMALEIHGDDINVYGKLIELINIGLTRLAKELNPKKTMTAGEVRDAYIQGQNEALAELGEKAQQSSIKIRFKDKEESNMKASPILNDNFTGSIDVVAGYNVADLTKDDCVELLGKLQSGVKVLEDSPAADTKYIQDKIVIKKAAIEIVTDILNK